MLKVLIVEPAGNLWGSERVLLDFLQQVNYSAHQILVCCPPGSPIVKLLQQIPVEISTSFEANLHRRGKFARLINTVRLLIVASRFRPHVIYVNQAGATRTSLLVGRILHTPVVTHVRMAQDVNYIISLKSTDNELPKIICISNYIRALFTNQSSINSRLITLYDSYTPQNLINAPSVHISKNELSLINVGRVTRTKGQDVLLKAVACLQRQGVETKAYFVGNVDENNEFETYLRKLSMDLGIVDQVIWLGFQDSVLNHMCNKDALVFTSFNEALGRVIFEAWDAGTIPVAWRGSGGAAEIIQASNGGFLYEEQTGESLAETLEQVFALSQSEREVMLNQGRQWLSENCNPAEYAQQMQNLWQAATSKL